MTEKELKRLSRADLLEMLIDQAQEKHKLQIKLQKLQRRLKRAEEALEDREIRIENAGSIAEAALQINGVFDAAQEACEQYMENARLRAEAMLAETEKKCQDMLAEAQARCTEMQGDSEQESDQTRLKHF